MSSNYTEKKVVIKSIEQVSELSTVGEYNI